MQRRLGVSGGYRDCGVGGEVEGCRLWRQCIGVVLLATCYEHGRMARRFVESPHFPLI